jgi:DMSO reductase anchor subunit
VLSSAQPPPLRITWLTMRRELIARPLLWADARQVDSCCKQAHSSQSLYDFVWFCRVLTYCIALEVMLELRTAAEINKMLTYLSRINEGVMRRYTCPSPFASRFISETF